PVAGYIGTPGGVTYQITDAYGQSATATYTPTVDEVIGTPTPPSLNIDMPSRIHLSPDSPRTFTTDCVVSDGLTSVCRIRVTAKVDGDMKLIAFGRKVLDSPADTVTVRVRIND